MAAAQLQRNYEDVDLVAPFGKGIEANASMIEIRLALTEWRRVSRPDWRIHLPTRGRA